MFSIAELQQLPKAHCVNYFDVHFHFCTWVIGKLHHIHNLAHISYIYIAFEDQLGCREIMTISNKITRIKDERIVQVATFSTVCSRGQPLHQTQNIHLTQG